MRDRLNFPQNRCHPKKYVGYLENQMPKTYPQRLLTLARNPKVKKAIPLEYEHEDGQCENCGGIGFMSFFLATMGPLDSPAFGHMVSKFHEGKWWAAPGYIEPAKDTEKTNMRFGTVSATCPACNGIRRVVTPVYIPMPEEVRIEIEKIKWRMTLRGVK